MTILNERLLARSRKRWRERIHNRFVQVRLITGETAATIQPGYESNTEDTVKEFNNFPCSYYEVLSSKLNRVFRARFEELNVPSGILDKTEWLVEYVPENYEMVVASGIAMAPTSATILNDTGQDFKALGVRPPLKSGVKGALIHNTTDGSIGYVTTVNQTTLVVASLTGGIDNQFEAGDAYIVYNVSDLQEGDQVCIRTKWRTVLMVVPDSENVQQTALMAD